MKLTVYCPTCERAGIKRRILEVDMAAKGIVFPYCKGCKREVEVTLFGDGTYKAKSR